MKLLLLVIFCVSAAKTAKLQNVYLPPQSASSAGGSGSFLNTPFKQSIGAGPSSAFSNSFGGSYSGSASTGSSFQRISSAPIGIVRFNNQNNGDGTYQFDFETENGISQQESGQLKNAGSDSESSSVQGSFSYVGDDGQTYTINYISDEYGFRPEGAHLPTPPPIPPEILKSLEQNAAEEAAGIFDDGQYKPQGGSGTGGGHSYSSGGGGGSSGYSGNVGAQSQQAFPSRQYLSPKASSNSQQGGYRY